MGALEGSAGGAGDESGDDVGGVTVEGDSGSVVAHRDSRVGVAGGFLHVAERYAGVECCGDERMSECVGSHTLGDAGAASNACHGPGRGVTIEPSTIETKEERS